MSTRHYPLPAVCLLLVLCLPFPLAAQEPEAFTLLGDDVGAAPSLAAVRSWQVAARFEVLRTAPPRVELPLGAGEIRAAEMVGFERRGAEDYTWRGRLAEGEGSVTLTVRGPELAGLIEVDGTAYEIVPRGRGTSSLVLLDSDRFPECGVAPREAGAEEPSPDVRAFSNAKHPDPQSRIDVMVLYTAAARNGAGGESQIRATAQAAVDAANTAYANSQITTRLRLVHVREAAYTEEGASYNAHLSWLASDPTVAALRNTYRADMVDLLVQDGAFCGLGFLMGSVSPSFAPSAFTVTTRSCAVGNFSFAHELGHNMGAHHDPANGGGTPAFPFSYGHFVNGSFRTVMSYNTQCPSGCTRVSQFSNPNVTFMGQLTGIANARDNHRTINGTDAVVANFRQEITASDFFTLTPCRVADTRTTAPLQSGVARAFQAGGVCGIPADAAAVALNVTVVGATGTGYLRLYTSGVLKPDSVVSTFPPGVALANNTILLLPGNALGTLTAEALVEGGGTVHVVLDAFGYFALPEHDQWTPKEPLPLGRLGAVSAVVGGKIWVIGGVGDSGLAVGTVESFDPATNLWQTGCPMTTPRAFASAAEVDGKIYVFGGRAVPGNPPELSVVERFDPAAASCATAWSARSAMPVARSEAAAAAVGGKVYLAGGVGTPLDLREYDPVLDTWALKAALPSGKTAAAAVTSTGKVYVIGGGIGLNAGSVLIYDPVADGWTAGASMPFSSRRHVAAALGGKIYATGGDIAAIQEYDPAADAWQMRAPLPTNRWYAAAGAVNGVLYVIGGGVTTGISDAHEAYVPPAP